MCAIFAVFEVNNAAAAAVTALHRQQHRADDACGIVTSDGRRLYRYARPGIVSEVFTEASVKQLPGAHALGHLRYSTRVDDQKLDNAQPLVFGRGSGRFALAHNGNLTNVPALLAKLPKNVKPKTSMDTELIGLRFFLAQGSITERIKSALDGVEGSYCLAFLFPDRIVAVRDRHGNRPYSLGKLNGAFMLASETCGLDVFPAEIIRDLRPGEILTISREGLQSELLSGPYPEHLSHCTFEQVYYALPSSVVYGIPVADFRYRSGQRLQTLFPAANADFVVPVPDSAIKLAEGFASSGRSGTLNMAILRHHHVPRTFIIKNPAVRNSTVARKFAIVREGDRGLKDRVIVLVDDSIVRLNTMPKIVAALRVAGVREIHVRIGCPPIRYPCRYGIDTPTREELAATTMTVSQMREKVEADTLEFLPLEELQELTGKLRDFCFACWTGEYPI